MRQESEIEKLVTLTEKLSPVPDFSQFEISSWEGWKEYRVVNGTMKSENIFNCGEAAICKTTLTRGSLLEEHIHPNSTELLVVLEGQLKLIVENRIHTLNKFDHIKIDKSVNHIAMASEDTLLIAMTIPKDDGFPE